MAYDHLLPNLPDGVTITAITTPDGKPAVNLKTAEWQAAVPISDDAAATDDAIIVQAWHEQALHEHKQRLQAASETYHGTLGELRVQHGNDRDAKIKAAREKIKKTKDQS